MINTIQEPFYAGGVFPEGWLTPHINSKEMFALYHVLLLFCIRHPGTLRRSQLLSRRIASRPWAHSGKHGQRTP